jgi:ketosteroid isomerase-like protein
MQMNKVRMLIGTLLILACGACTPAPSGGETKKDAAADKAKDVADIKAMEEQFVAATKTKDVNAIMAFYVPDESLFVFDVVPPRQYVGAAAYRKDWEDTLSLFPGPIEASMSDLDVTADGGEIAYGHSIQRVSGMMKDGNKLDLTVRVTDGYKKVNGKWLIAMEHVSVPVDLMTGKADLTSKP